MVPHSLSARPRSLVSILTDGFYGLDGSDKIKKAHGVLGSDIKLVTWYFRFR